VSAQGGGCGSPAPGQPAPGHVTPGEVTPGQVALERLTLGRLALARGTLDRAAHRRGDERWLAAAWADPRTRVLVIEDGKALVRFRAGADGSGPSGGGAGADEVGGGAELVLVSPADAPEGPRLLLGVDADDVAYFAVLGALPVRRRDGEPAAGDASPAGLRQAGALLGDRDSGLFTHAVALANWHATHEHCPRCGAVTRLSAAGHTRVCPRDGSEHFPRVDPAVIMLVLDPAGRCLLARNRNWPEKRVSILAGFVEPGESVEQAVAREVREEVGLAVGGFRYLGSQPWPMPQSLMLGFAALAIWGHQANPDLEIRVDSHEIAEARWYSRGDLRTAIAAREILLPPPVSIAHRIIEAWYGAPLPGAW
jgi:NAD+ diphosphatase